MKIFSCAQVREIDEFTVSHEPVASVDLMERAAGKVFSWYVSKFDRSHRIMIFAGPGNNGGDGLALARMLYGHRYDVGLYFVKFSDKTSPDWEKNRIRVQTETDIRLKVIDALEKFPLLSADDIIIDAIFGSGLARPAEGLPAAIIRELNKSDCTKVAIDVPSGLFCEDNSRNLNENIVMADYTVSFQFPKLSFLFAENYRYTGEWSVLPIGLSTDAINNISSPYSIVEKSDVLPMLRRRSRFDHKGNFGHGLFISGSYGKIGACILGAKAALRSGIGLITCHIPSCGNSPIHASVPEAMLIADRGDEFISSVGKTDKYSAVGVGPGLGMAAETQEAMYNLLSECRKPMIIDADALNILSVNKAWLKKLPEATILTPHPKEFERLAGKSADGFDRLNRQLKFSREYNCIVILKGAYTSITTSDGKVFFNSSGNPGMATAGSGDVLSGILLSLLAQGLEPQNAAVLGVFLHGLAGDLAAEDSCYESIIASDIINYLGMAFNKIRES